MTSNAISQSVDFLPQRRLTIAILEEACAGGSGRHVADLASHLAAAGHHVHLLYSSTHLDDRFRDGLKDLQALGGWSTALPLQHNVHPSDVGSILEVRAYLLKHGPFDIFHCHSTKAGFLGRLAAMGLGIPIIYTPHAFLSMSPVSGRISFLGAHFVERILSNASDIIICVSEEEMNHARALGIPRAKIRMIPNGISLRDAQEAKALRSIVRRELNLAGTDVCIGAVGRLVEQKAFHVLIDAFALAIPQLAQNVKLVIVGDGPLLSGLQRLATRRSVQGRVMFQGRLPGLRTMSAFDLFAMSSCSEGHPYTLIEALALGLPIVTTAIGGAQSSVLPGVNGFVSPIGDAKSMAGNLVTVAQSPALRGQMASASLRIANQFTLETMLRRITQVYEEQVKTTGYAAQAASAGR